MLSYYPFLIFNEGVMEYLLTSLGLKDLRSEYGNKQLLATANQIRHGRVDNVASKVKNFRGWDTVGAEFIIDRVYGLDYIAEIKPSNQRIAFDFTTDPSKVAEKIAKAKEFAPLWKSLGVEKVVILLTVYPDGTDQGLAFYDKDEAQDDILGVVYNAIEGTEEVSSATIHCEYE
jgi:hypothetical protein